jgi:hypothetical protein
MLEPEVRISLVNRTKPDAAVDSADAPPTAQRQTRRISREGGPLCAERGKDFRRAKSTKQWINSDSVGQDWAVNGLPVEVLLDSPVVALIVTARPVATPTVVGSRILGVL